MRAILLAPKGGVHLADVTDMPRHQGSERPLLDWTAL